MSHHGLRERYSQTQLRKAASELGISTDHLAKCLVDPDSTDSGYVPNSDAATRETSHLTTRTKQRTNCTGFETLGSWNPDVTTIESHPQNSEALSNESERNVPLMPNTNSPTKITQSAVTSIYPVRTNDQIIDQHNFHPLSDQIWTATDHGTRATHQNTDNLGFLSGNIDESQACYQSWMQGDVERNLGASELQPQAYENPLSFSAVMSPVLEESASFLGNISSPQIPIECTDGPDRYHQQRGTCVRPRDINYEDLEAGIMRAPCSNTWNVVTTVSTSKYVFTIFVLTFI